jgi:hypothetical protein
MYAQNFTRLMLHRYDAVAASTKVCVRGIKAKGKSIETFGLMASTMPMMTTLIGTTSYWARNKHVTGDQWCNSCI